MTNDEYYKAKAISKSQLKLYLDSPWHFWNSSPFNPNAKPFVEGDATAFGTLAHCLLFEPHTFTSNFVIEDFGKSRKNKSYVELASLHPGKRVITQTEYEKAHKMIVALKRNKLAAQIIKDAEVEREHFWKHESTGLPLKGKLDAIKRTVNGIVIIDYKTTSDVSKALKSIQEFGNHLQMAMYTDMVRTNFQEDPYQFLFIIQSSCEGEEDIIAIAEIERESEMFAHGQLYDLLSEISKKMDMYHQTGDEGIWAAYPQEVIPCKIPAYYMQQWQYRNETMKGSE